MGAQSEVSDGLEARWTERTRIRDSCPSEYALLFITWRVRHRTKQELQIAKPHHVHALPMKIERWSL